jgi:hypothetical protein
VSQRILEYHNEVERLIQYGGSRNESSIRSAFQRLLEWVLDRYKEKTPKDPTICETFNTYRFADYKEQVIDLLMRVCNVSVETMKLISKMDAVVQEA